jgi:hypothetical protein
MTFLSHSLEKMDLHHKPNDITYHPPVAAPLPVKPVPTLDELVDKIMHSTEGAQITCPP